MRVKVRIATIMRRIETTLRRWFLVGVALLAPAALLPDGVGYAILDAITSFNVVRIAEIAAVTNALTLIP
jgi:hypothetical protein